MWQIVAFLPYSLDMEKHFWLERWQKQEIGFHQADINQYLKKFWSEIKVNHPDSQVFVPLCGKSSDMLWLNQQGHEVLGIEFSEMAVQDFFSENKLPYKEIALDNFKKFETADLSLMCGDFFQLTAQTMEHCHLVYDRASLVALPESMRKHYADKMIEILPDDAVMLLITMEYPQEEMNGPPFSVSEEEVRNLYMREFNVNKLGTYDIFAENPRFQAKGLSALSEKVFALTRA